MQKELAYWLCNFDDHADSEALDNTYQRKVSLYRLSSDEFQVIEMGVFRSVLNGPGYLIVKKGLADILKKNVPEQIICKDVRIFRRATNEEWLDYSEIILKTELKYSNYYETKCEGIQLFHMDNSSIYVSPELKTLIENDLKEYQDITLKQEIPLRYQ